MENSDTLKFRPLGRSDLNVSPIGLGVMQFSGSKGIFSLMLSEIAQDQKNEIIQAALDGGINWFDTAEMYGRGRSERSLAAALKKAGKEDPDIIIGTKWFPIFRTASNIPKTINDRIHHLDGFSIDLYMIHNPWGFSSPEAEMDAMAKLVEAGVIRHVGVSNFNAEQMRRAHARLAECGLPLAVNQVEFSLLNRKIETNGILETAKDLGVAIVAWGPLASGILSAKFHRDPDVMKHTPSMRGRRLARRLEVSLPVIEVLEEIAPKYNATPAQVALNWLINYHGEHVFAIPGASKVSQAEQSAGAMTFRLSDTEMEKLKNISRGFK